MAKEIKLLLRYICAALPYGLKIHINSYIEEQNQMRLFNVNLESQTIGVKNEKWTFKAIPIVDNEDETKIIKPYLRPMSSMTEEEKKTLNNILEYQYCSDDSQMCEASDWLNENHFDYRGLIPMGLALEATKDMYK